MTIEPFKIGIVGSYGGLNLGDEAILHAIIEQIRSSIPAEITVFSRNAEDTEQRHAPHRVIPSRRMSKAEVIPEIDRLDLLIFGGGGILFDSEASEFLREANLAHQLNVPVMAYALGAGPLKEEASQAAVRESLNQFQLITVRENQARRVLEQAGVTHDMVVTADPAFLLKPEPITAPIHELSKNERPLVAFSVREPGNAAPDLDVSKYHGLIADAADYMIDRYGVDVIFVPMEPQVHDIQHSHAVISHMLFPDRANVLKTKLTSAQLLDVMSRFEFAVGMRLHFLIFAALQGVPFTALPYASKVNGLLETLEMETPPIQKINAGRLIAYIDRAWDQRKKLKEKIEAKIPEFKQRSQKTHKYLLHLLKHNRSRQQGELSDYAGFETTP